MTLFELNVGEMRLDAEAPCEVVQKQHPHPLGHGVFFVKVERDAVADQREADFAHGNEQEFHDERRVVRRDRDAFRNHQDDEGEREERLDYERHALTDFRRK